MATTMYGLARAGYLACTSAYSWTGANIQLAFVTTSYTPTYATDQFLGIAVPGGAIIAQSGNLASTTGTLGTANAANETVSSVSGAQFAYVILYYSTGTNNTSGLIMNIDTATGLPCTPNGGNIVVQWDTGSNKIFTLCKEVDVSEWNGTKMMGRGLRMVAEALASRFGVPVFDRTYNGTVYYGKPELHMLKPTPEQEERHFVRQQAQRDAAKIQKRYGGRIPVIA